MIAIKITDHPIRLKCVLRWNQSAIPNSLQSSDNQIFAKRLFLDLVIKMEHWSWTFETDDNEGFFVKKRWQSLIVKFQSNHHHVRTLKGFDRIYQSAHLIFLDTKLEKLNTYLARCCASKASKLLNYRLLASYTSFLLSNGIQPNLI